MIKDINPGTDHGYPQNLTVFGDQVLFTANDGVGSYELWSITFLDTTALVVTITTSGNNVTVGAALKAAFTCSDEGGSGLATCTATDGAGNTTTKTVTINVVAATVVKDNSRELKGDYAFWVQHSAKDLTMWEIAEYFTSSEEFAVTYADLDNSEFVELLYGNVMGRTSETEGHAYWTSLLDNGVLTRGGVTLQFSESPEFKVLTKSS